MKLCVWMEFQSFFAFYPGHGTKLCHKDRVVVMKDRIDDKEFQENKRLTREITKKAAMKRFHQNHFVFALLTRD